MLKPGPKSLLWLAVLVGCAHPAPAVQRGAVAPVVVALPPVERAAPPPPDAYRAKLGHGAELYLPPGFSAREGRYDLLVHFHGEGKYQEANVARAELAVAVVSVNLGGLGTEPYGKAFKAPEAFPRLLEAADAEIAKRGPAKLGRLALSAWSAGYSSIAAILNEQTAEQVDAILLADGLFAAFSDAKKRTINDAGLDRIVRFAERAKRGEKLFALTHGAIPTGPYPSVQECTARMLDRLTLAKTAASGDGPRGMRRTYVVDEGDLHIAGFDGVTAGDHVKELHAMGESVYPYLKARWSR